MQLSRRFVSYTDPVTGDVLAEEQAKSGVHKLIDQVMESEGKPMFSDDDFETLSTLDAEKLSPLYDAIDAFNDDQKKSIGRVQRYIEELKRNHRFRSAVKVCEMLNIDDPILWMNSVEAKTLDLWIAWLVVKEQPEQMQPAEQVLQKMAKQWQSNGKRRDINHPR